MGAANLGLVAMLTDDDAERARLLGEGEALLEEQVIGHNQFLFRVAAMEVALQERDVVGLVAQVELLEAFMGEEPIPWAVRQLERARTYANALRRGRPLEGATFRTIA